jgi:hypothetical protein
MPVSDVILDINEFTNQALTGVAANAQLTNSVSESQFRKIYRIMEYILEIFYVGLLFSKLNIMLKKTGAGFAPTSIREYEWIIANFGNFKRELNNLGNPIQYNDLEQYMRFKAQYFCYKYRLLLDRCYEYFACNGVTNLQKNEKLQLK